MTNIGREKLINQILTIPEELLIKQFNDFNYSLIVTARLGDMINNTVKLTFDWFFAQKYFKKVVIEDLNGITVTLERTE